MEIYFFNTNYCQDSDILTSFFGKIIFINSNEETTNFEIKKKKEVDNIINRRAVSIETYP